MKEKILEILNSYKEGCKVGSDGDYENYEAIFTEYFNDLADEIVKKLNIDDVSNSCCEHCESKRVTIGDSGLWCDDCRKLTKKK